MLQLIWLDARVYVYFKKLEKNADLGELVTK